MFLAYKNQCIVLKDLPITVGLKSTIKIQIFKASDFA